VVKTLSLGLGNIFGTSVFNNLHIIRKTILSLSILPISGATRVFVGYITKLARSLSKKRRHIHWSRGAAAATAALWSPWLYDAGDVGKMSARPAWLMSWLNDMASSGRCSIAIQKHGQQLRHVLKAIIRYRSSGTFYSYRRLSAFFPVINWGALGRLAIWHLSGGPVGPPARWAATSNVERGSETKEGTREGSTWIFAVAPEFLVTPLLRGPVCLISQGRFEEPVRSWSLMCGTPYPTVLSLRLLWTVLKDSSLPPTSRSDFVIISWIAVFFYFGCWAHIRGFGIFVSTLV